MLGLCVKSLMNRSCILLLLALAFLPACANFVERRRRDFDSEFYWGAESRLFTRPDLPPQFWGGEASDPKRSPEDRAHAVFALFATYVRPGFTSHQMRAALPDTRWLEACSLVKIMGGSGQIDIDWWSGTAFCLRVCPDEKGWSAWVITFTLTNQSTGPSLTSDDALAFIKGTHTNKQIRLAEFNLSYPRDPRLAPTYFSERFTKKGVGLKVR